MTLLLTGADVAELLTLDDCIAAVEDAFRAHGEGRLHPPGIVSEHADAGAFHIKTALVGDRFAAKANANFPGNRSHGLPTIQGVLLLFDARLGRVLAIMDSIELTILRTGAATAVAAKYLAPRNARSAAVVGCGKQGRVQLESIKRVLPIEQVVAFDTDPACAAEFARTTNARIVTSLDAMKDADIWLTCTTSKRPFLGTRHVKPGAFVAGVGADNPEKSELEPGLMRAARVVGDSVAQCREIGDLHHAPDVEHADELGAIVAGRTRGRERNDEILIFDSTGLGFQDTAAASIVYDRALVRGFGQEINLAR